MYASYIASMLLCCVHKTFFFLQTYQNVYFNTSTGTEEAVEVLKVNNTWMGVVRNGRHCSTRDGDRACGRSNSYFSS